MKLATLNKAVAKNTELYLNKTYGIMELQQDNRTIRLWIMAMDGTLK